MNNTTPTVGRWFGLGGYFYPAWRDPPIAQAKRGNSLRSLSGTGNPNKVEVLTR